MIATVNIALPAIGHQFAMSTVVLNWVATSFLLAAAIFLVPMGRVADIYGRRTVFLYGISFFAAGSLLISFARSTPLLLSFRVLQGIGGAMISGTSVALLTSAFPGTERGRVLGINAAAVYLGLSLGPFAGGLLTAALGWRSVFWVCGLLGLAAVVVALFWLKSDRAESGGEQFDWAGSLVYGMALFALMYGVSTLTTLRGVMLAIGGIIAMAAFVVWETRVNSPVLNLSLFRNNRPFVFSSLSALINYSATFSVGLLLSLYLQLVKGMRPELAGLVLVVQPAVQVVLSPVTGRLSDRIEPRVLASWGMALTTVGLLIMAFIRISTPLAVIITGLLVLGTGLAFFSSPNTNAVMSSVDRRFYGVASGTLGTMRLVGQVLSMSIILLTQSVYLGHLSITPGTFALFVHSMQAALIVMTALSFAGIFASLARGTVHSE